MATIIHTAESNFQPNLNKIDGFRLLTDTLRTNKGVNPQYLNFDVRKLMPGEFNAPYHYHRYADELFYIISGTAELRTCDGLSKVSVGDILFFEAGECGAHQLFNCGAEPCVYLDMRSYIGHDVCIYPDSNKLITIPEGEIFQLDNQCDYFEGETNPLQRRKADAYLKGKK